jgi:hypothetical protein
MQQFLSDKKRGRMQAPLNHENCHAKKETFGGESIVA